MPASRFALLFPATLLLLSVVGASGAPSPRYRASRERRISYAGLDPRVRVLCRRERAELYRVFLPATPGKPLALRDSLELLRQSCSRAGRGVSISLRLPAGIAFDTLDSLPHVTLPARPFTAAEGFDTVCAAADLLWSVEQFGIVLRPRYEPSPHP